MMEDFLRNVPGGDHGRRHATGGIRPVTHAVEILKFYIRSWFDLRVAGGIPIPACAGTAPVAGVPFERQRRGGLHDLNVPAQAGNQFLSATDEILRLILFTLPVCRALKTMPWFVRSKPAQPQGVTTRRNNGRIVLAEQHGL